MCDGGQRKIRKGGIDVIPHARSSRRFTSATSSVFARHYKLPSIQHWATIHFNQDFKLMIHPATLVHFMPSSRAQIFPTFTSSNNRSHLLPFLTEPIQTLVQIFPKNFRNFRGSYAAVGDGSKELHELRQDLSTLKGGRNTILGGLAHCVVPSNVRGLWRCPAVAVSLDHEAGRNDPHLQTRVYLARR